VTPAENDLLCLVEGDAPMGKLMRQFWVPALLSEEIEVDGKPTRVKLFGEPLVAYRDSNGTVGLMGEFCPHRGASLVYGRNEKCALRCLYHGWKMDAEGTILEMPSEPTASPLKQKIKQKAYPTKEWGGFVWAFMGDQANIPEFLPPPFCPNENAKVSISKIKIPCNWAQITEGQIDSAHSSSLHSSDMVPAPVEFGQATDTQWLRPSTDKSPRFEIQETDFGFRYAAIRRPIKQATTHDYVRVTVYVAPFISLIPPNTSYRVATVIVPIDNENTAFHFIAFGEGDVPSTQTWRKFLSTTVGEDLNPDYTNRRHLGNDFMQDRELMKQGNYTGISGIPNQDIAMWVGMGPIANRSHDILGASDQAIVTFRRLMHAAAKATGEGKTVFDHSTSTISLDQLKAWEEVVDKGTNWRLLGAAPEEIQELQS